MHNTNNQEGANKHSLLTNPGSTNCILFQNSLCCPAQRRLASLQLALERKRKKTSPFCPFHTSMNSVHKQTQLRHIHKHLSGVQASFTLSSTLGKQIGWESSPSVLHCSRNIFSTKKEISHWKTQIRTVTLMPVRIKAVK